MKTQPGDKVRVCYIDYGNSEEVDVSDLRHLPEDLALAKLPPQAKECFLSGVQCVDVIWSDEVVAYFEEIVSEKKLLAEVVKIESDNSCMAVLLRDMGVSIAQKLKEGGFVIEDTMTKYLRKVKDDQDSSEDDSNLKSVSVDDKEQKLCADGDAQYEEIPQFEEFNARKEPCTVDSAILPITLPVKVEIPVYLSHCDSPSNFFIQLADTYQLDQLNESIQRAYTEEEDLHKFKTRVNSGMVCAVFSQEDNSWYRAKVLSIAGDNILVNNIDFGNNETVTANEVKPLQKQFLGTPAQAVQCTLSDISPLTSEDNWSQECIETFMAETGMQRELLAEIQSEFWTSGPQGDVIMQSVKLFAGETSIADVLVDAGLATYSTECEVPKFRLELN